MMKIKTGDKVTSNDPELAGKIGTVENHFGIGEYEVSFPDSPRRLYMENGGRDPVCGSDWLTVVSTRLKVGDKVVSNFFGVGEVVTVLPQSKYVKDTFSGYTVNFKDTMGAWYTPDLKRYPDFGTDVIVPVEEKKEKVKMPTPRYKVGDKVLVRSDLKVGKCGSDTVVKEMISFAGKVVTISKVYENDCYKISEFSYNWTDEMFAGLAKETDSINMVYVRFGHDEKTFLFGVPYSVTLTDGQKVYVKTKRADRSVATVVGDSFKVDSTALKNICKGSGIQPESLQQVIGLAVEKKTYDFASF